MVISRVGIWQPQFSVLSMAESHSFLLSLPCPVNVLHCALLAQKKQTSTECTPKNEQCYTKWLSQNIEKSQVEPTHLALQPNNSSPGPFYQQDTNPILEGFASRPNHFPRAPPTNTIHYVEDQVSKHKLKEEGHNQTLYFSAFCWACDSGVDSVRIYFSNGLSFNFFFSQKVWGEVGGGAWMGVGGGSLCLPLWGLSQNAPVSPAGSSYTYTVPGSSPPEFSHLLWGVCHTSGWYSTR